MWANSLKEAAPYWGVGGGALILTKGTALGWKFTQCTLKLTLRGI